MRTKIWPSFLLILIAIPAWATPAATVTFSRPLAMGEAYRAAGAANGAIYLNPAGMSRLNMYATELSYMRGELGGDDDTLHLSIVDTKTQPVGVGVGYSFSAADVDRHDGRLAASYPLVPDLLYLGGSARYLVLDPESGDNESALSLDVGWVVAVGGGLFIGGLVDNAVPDENIRETTGREVGGGVGYEGQRFSLEVNGVYDPDAGDVDTESWRRLRWHGGLELMVSGSVSLRGGWTWRPARDDGAHQASFGVGYISRSGAIDLAYRPAVDGGGSGTFAVGLRSFM